MRLVKELWLPFLIVIVPGIAFSLLLPYFPVDETRYLSVAWEMRLHDSLIVPLQNAQPYSHKPPLLFWLVNLNWFLFGVNELTLRCIPVLFSLFNVTLVYRIALLLWNDERIARYASLILASTAAYLLWSVLIMFDVVLTFWVLLAVFGLLCAAKRQDVKAWLTVGLALGGGLLTKGPVVFVYVLPVALLAFLWIPRERWSAKWYAWLGLALLVGIAIILAWLIPAALTGGEAYKKAILWGQTVNRMANAFAHKRPFWWYLPWLPPLLFPWVILKPAWRPAPGCNGDRGGRFILIWIGSALVILSCISSKQVHYLIPVLPAFSLIMARNFASFRTRDKGGSWRFAVGGFYSIAGAAAVTLSFLRLGKVVEQTGIWGLRAFGAGLLVTGIALLLLHRGEFPRLVQQIALSSAAVLLVTGISGGAMFGRYELHPIGEELRAKQREGYTVLHYGKYHGQYQFIGRLAQPLVPLDSLQEIGQYAATHEKVALISYEPRLARISRDDLFFEQPFRSRKVVLWNRKGISDFVKQQEELQQKPEAAAAGE